MQPGKTKISRATLVGGNTDGKSLYLTIEVFDGEHNNRFTPVFPFKTKAKEVIKYMQSIIEDNPQFPEDLKNLMQNTLFWDNDEEAWYTQMGSAKPVRVK